MNDLIPLILKSQGCNVSRICPFFSLHHDINQTTLINIIKASEKKKSTKSTWYCCCNPHPWEWLSRQQNPTGGKWEEMLQYNNGGPQQIQIPRVNHVDREIHHVILPLWLKSWTALSALTEPVIIPVALNFYKSQWVTGIRTSLFLG